MKYKVKTYFEGAVSYKVTARNNIEAKKIAILLFNAENPENIKQGIKFHQESDKTDRVSEEGYYVTLEQYGDNDYQTTVNYNGCFVYDVDAKNDEEAKRKAVVLFKTESEFSIYRHINNNYVSIKMMKSLAKERYENFKVTFDFEGTINYELEADNEEDAIKCADALFYDNETPEILDDKFEYRNVKTCVNRCCRLSVLI